MSEDNCGNCVYWEVTVSRAHENEDLKYGNCRRHAPHPGLRDIIWPRVSAIEWCGEHKSTID